MICKPILFWAVWLLVFPLVFLFFCLSPRGSLRAQWQYWRSGLVGTKTGLVRRAVRERLVSEKTVQRHLFNLDRRFRRQ